MKRLLILPAILLAGLLALPSTALAEHRSHRPRWGFEFGVGLGGGYFRGGYQHVERHRHRAHVHTRAPIYSRIWHPPVHRTVFAGYDRCGFPIYRTVETCGYWETVVVGYRCSGCGSHCD